MRVPTIAIGGLCFVAAFVWAQAPPRTDAPQRTGGVAALGRIEPRLGVRHLAGPPRPVVVIEQLRVEEGDVVHRGDVLAVLP